MTNKIENLINNNIDIDNQIAILLQSKENNKKDIVEAFKTFNDIKIGDIYKNEKEAIVISNIEYRKTKYGDKEETFCIDHIALDDSVTYFFTARNNSLYHRDNLKYSDLERFSFEKIGEVELDFITEYVTNKSKLHSHIFSKVLFDVDNGLAFNLSNTNKTNNNEALKNLRGIESLKGGVVDVIVDINDFKEFAESYKELYTNVFDTDNIDDDNINLIIRNDIKNFKKIIETNKCLEIELESMVCNDHSLEM